MNRIYFNLLLMSLMMWRFSGVVASTTIDVNTLTNAQTLSSGSYVITGDNTASGSAIANPFTVSGSVSITLDHVSFKTLNTVATNFITVPSGSKVNIVLKGNNIFDWKTVTGGGSVVSISGGSTPQTFSEATGGGSIKLLVATSGTTSYQTIYYAPSSTTGTLSISGGSYSCDNTGNGNASATRVINTGDTGASLLTISGGVFEVLNSGTGTNNSATINLYSGGTTTGMTCNISGGNYRSLSGKVIVASSGKYSNTSISGGNFSNDGTNPLLLNLSSGTMSITSPTDRYLHLTDKEGTKTTLAAGTTDGRNISTYTNSLHIAACYIVKFYSDLDKAFVRIQESDTSSFLLDRFNRSWFTINSLGDWENISGKNYPDNSLVNFSNENYILELFPIISAATFIDISTVSSTRALTTGDYVIVGDNTNTGSSIPTSIFSIASGNTVNVTLYDMKFKTNNTAATKLIDAVSGSNMNLVLKGDNLFDGQTLTAPSNAIAMAGGGTYNFSSHSSGGKFCMYVAASTGTFQPVSYNPSGTNGKFIISGGIYQCEYKGTATSGARIIGTGGTGTAVMTIKGGVFEIIHSGSGSNTGNLISLGSGSTTSGITCTISDGTFRSIGGNTLYSSANKWNKIIINGGSFYNNGKASLFNAGTASGGIIINSTLAKSILLTDNSKTQKRLYRGNVDTTAINTYKGSLTIVPYYVVDFYSDSTKSVKHTQNSDTSSLVLQSYNGNWFSPALGPFHEWTDGKTSYLNADSVTFAADTYVIELYPSNGPFRWFVSQDGNNSNDGTSWKKAWKWDILRLPASDVNSLTNKGVMAGDTIYMASGPYNVASSNNNPGAVSIPLNIVGGYNVGENVQTISPDNSKYPVLTTTNSTTGEAVNGKLLLFSVTSAAKPVLFRGCVFQDIYVNASDENGGIICTSPSHQASLKFEKCTFNNNTTNSRGLFCLSNEAYEVALTNCTLAENMILNAPTIFSTRSMFYGLGTNGESLAKFSFRNCKIYNNSSPSNAIISGKTGGLSAFNSFFINNISYPYASSNSTAWSSSSNNYACLGLNNCSSRLNIEASIISNNVYKPTLSASEQSLYTSINSNLNSANTPANNGFYKDLYVENNSSVSPRNCILNGAFYGYGNDVSYMPALNKADLLSVAECSNLISGNSTIDDILSKYDNTTGTYWKSTLLDVSYSGLLTYKSDSDGFVLPDFGNAGYKNGKEEYPNYQPKSSRIVTVSPLADPIADNTANIQAAIDQVSSLTPDSIGMRGVVYINAGKYYLDGSLTVTSSGVVIRGAGRGPDVANPSDLSNITWLHGRGTGTGKEISIIKVGSGTAANWSGTIRSNMTHTGKVGDYKIVVEDASQFKVGDNVCVCMPWTEEFLSSIWYGGNSNCDRWGSSSGFEYHRYINSIADNVITLDAPLFMTLDLKYGQPYLRKITAKSVAQCIGLENFRISMDRTPADTLTAPAQNCIKMTSMENCWAKGLRLSDYIHAGITTESCTRITIDDVWSVDASGYKSAGNYYSFESYNRSQLILYRNCQARGGRHDYIGNGSQLVSGIVLTGFQSQQDAGSEAGHRNFGQGVLFDNWNQWSTGGSIGAFLRNNMGTMHGWGAVHCVMWNCNMGNGSGTILLDKVPGTQNYAIACNAATIRKYTTTRPCAANSYSGASYKTGYIEGQKSSLPIRPSSLYAAQNFYRWQGTETRGDIYIAGGYACVSRATPGETVTIYPGNDPLGKTFVRWEVVKGDVTLVGNSFVMGEQDVIIKAMYNSGIATESKQTSRHKALSYINGTVYNNTNQFMYIYSVDGVLRKTATKQSDISKWPTGVYIVATNTEMLKVLK